jgi:Spy/CpxP family protein refolding chaperone
MTGHWKDSLGVLMVFILGCLAGILAASVYFSHRDTAFFQRGSAAYIDLAERRLTRNLNLDATQKQQIHQYFLENLAERKQLQAQIQPAMQMVNHHTFGEIRSVLQPEQLTIFRENLTEFRKRLARNGGNPPPGPNTGAATNFSTNTAPENPPPAIP